MIRTQIYLPEEVYQRLNKLAKKRGDRMAEWVRYFVEQGLQQEEVKNTAHGLVELAHLAKQHGWSGPTDLAKHHNTYFVEAWEEQQKNRT